MIIELKQPPFIIVPSNFTSITTEQPVKCPYKNSREELMGEVFAMTDAHVQIDDKAYKV